MRRAMPFVLLLTCLASRLTAEPGQAADPVASLRETELAFAQSVAERDPSRFRSFIDPQAVFASGRPLRGPDAIVEAWSDYFRPGGPPLLWCPARVVVTDSGDLGMTSGPYETELKKPDGGTVRVRGTFFSVWRRHADGSWRILFDSGTSSRPVEPGASEKLECSAN